MDEYKKINEASAQIKAILNDNGCDQHVDTFIALGSGLGPFADTFEQSLKISNKDLPHFPTTTVQGHAGEIVISKINDKVCMFQKGRLHAYEGHSYNDVIRPLRIARNLGAKTLILTNAAGGINPSYSPGDLVLIKDHINLSGRNPLVGKNIDELGPRFPDLSEVYSYKLMNDTKKIAQDNKILVKEGVYIHVSGPSYETPAEIRMFAKLGADMVGMSTVPEAIAGKHCDMNILGISCITNYAAGIVNQKLTHEDVQDVAKKTMEKFSNLLNLILTKL
ncbi:MAG: purine-nucleoside phosphorylase [Halobacteriovoraceae bacterium]|nr:purine-nucleoside phosphorylase [Halobacteriovoraceae bacterium]MCB9093968.1 purine-nucleoside phosphorylase [Halobacteriovoraceae bacterium]